jgi:hypothetical protein
MELSAWVASRERGALKRVRTVGLGLAGILFILTVWLGWREARLTSLSQHVEGALQAENRHTTRLRLKALSQVIYLAKVRANSLLADMTDKSDLSAPCLQLNCMRSLDASSACVVAWETNLTRIWKAAFSLDAPPTGAEMQRDVWGAPYLLDQSEASCGNYGAWCPHDVVSSAGPDSKPNTDDDIHETIPQHLGPSRVKLNGSSPSQ